MILPFDVHKYFRFQNILDPFLLQNRNGCAHGHIKPVYNVYCFIPWSKTDSLHGVETLVQSMILVKVARELFFCSLMAANIAMFAGLPMLVLVV